MDTGLALAVAVVLAGAFVQSAAGFGFALVSAPALAAAAGPREAVAALACLSVLHNGMTLGSERRPVETLGPLARTILLWSLPGMAAGAFVLAHASRPALQVAVAVAVLAAVLAQAATTLGPARSDGRPPGAPGPEPEAEGRPGGCPPRSDRPPALVGLLSGVLSTTVALNGPPIVLLLLRRGATPAQVRDTLAAIFVALALLTVAVLAVSGTLAAPPVPLAFAAVTIAGHLAGRRAFAALHRHYELAALAVLLLSAALALVAGVSAL